MMHTAAYSVFLWCGKLYLECTTQKVIEQESPHDLLIVFYLSIAITMHYVHYWKRKN